MNNADHNRYSLHERRGFSLIEMLVVLVIMGMLFAVVVPTMVEALNGTRITQSGDEFYGLISQAQQMSSAKGHPVEVRFYRAGDGGESGSTDEQGDTIGYRGLIILSHYFAGEPNPDNLAVSLTSPLSVAEFGGIHSIPTSFVINEGLSTLINDAPIKGTGSGGAGAIKVRTSTGLTDLNLPSNWGEYVGFLCLPEGTNLNPGDDQRWYLTFVEARNATAAAAGLKNFYTIQIDPVTGRLSAYRP